MPPIGGKFTLVEQGTRLFDRILEHAKDCKPIVVQWVAILKSNAREEFDQNVPPLAASTRKRYEQEGKGALTSRGNLRASAVKAIDQRLAKKAKKATGDDGYRIDQARAELRRLASGDLSKGGSANSTIDRLRRRAVTAKVARASGIAVATGKKKITDHKRGGKMRNAFRGKVSGLVARVENMVPFSGVMDQGGPVGNGATLPRWGFTNISSHIRGVLARVAVDWLLGGDK